MDGASADGVEHQGVNRRLGDVDRVVLWQLAYVRVAVEDGLAEAFPVGTVLRVCGRVNPVALFQDGDSAPGAGERPRGGGTTCPRPDHEYVGTFGHAFLPTIVCRRHTAAHTLLCSVKQS